MFARNPDRQKNEPVEEQNKGSQYARSLIGASLDPLVTISADGKITDVDEATVAATAVPREELCQSAIFL